MAHGCYPWRPWRPEVVAERLAGVDVAWCVAVGCAIDLFHGSPTRAPATSGLPYPAAHFAAIATRFPDLDSARSAAEPSTRSPPRR